jgi:autotransporter translocation and assembly factor TamB
MEKGWMMVWTVEKEYFAELIKKMLADHDIQAVSINKKDSSYTTFGDIEIYVKEENHLKARTLIKEFVE